MAPTAQSKDEPRDLTGTVYLITSDGRILNLPLPSASPHDPLNWSLKRRVLAALAIGFFSFVGLVAVLAPGLGARELLQQFSPEETAPFGVDALSSAPTFFIGVGAFIWVPLSLAVGRRPVFVFCAVLLLLAILSAGFAQTFYQLLGAVCVIGLAEGFSLSAALLVLIDLTFIHQRPHAIAMVWSIAGFFGSTVVSTVSLATNSGTRWQNFYFYWAIPAGVSCVMAFTLCSETYFKRPSVAFDGYLVMQSATEITVLYENQADEFKDKTLPDTPSQSRWRAVIEWLRMPRATAGSWKAMARCYLQVLLCLLNPLIFWVALLNAMVFAGMMFIGETYAFVLSTEPYRLPYHLIVLVNFSAGVGGLLAWPALGPLMARLVKSLSRRNKGVCEAEQYLLAFVLPVLAGTLSTMIYGFAVQHHWHFSLFCLAYGFNGFSYTGLAIANTLWVTGAFPRWAAPALIIVGGGSYMVNYGLSAVIIPWLNSQGPLRVGLQLSALQFGLGVVIAPLVYCGKKARQYIQERWGKWEGGALRPR